MRPQTPPDRKFVQNKTISDDRSLGSEFTRNRRDLVALKKVDLFGLAVLDGSLQRAL